MAALLFPLVSLLAVRSAVSADHYVYDKVGNGSSGYTRDGYTGPATLISGHSAGMDAAGGYFSDTGSGLLRKIAPSTGLVSTLVGGGGGAAAYGSSVSGTSVALSDAITGVVSDTSSVFFAEASLVYRFTLSTGNVDILAGSTDSGDVDDADGQNARFSFDSASGVGISDLAVDDLSETLYVCDRGNNKVKAIRLVAPFETTVVAGTGFADLYYFSAWYAQRHDLVDPVGLAYASPYIYISEFKGNRVLRVDLSSQNQMIYLFAGQADGTAGWAGDGGDATSAAINGPYGLAVDSSSSVFIADSMNNRIRRVDGATNIIDTLVGTGAASGLEFYNGCTALSAVVQSPAYLSVDSSGDLWYSSRAVAAIRVVAATQRTSQPSARPSAQPSREPSAAPSAAPSLLPTGQPTQQPVTRPTGRPSAQPIASPSSRPSAQPSQHPSSTPSAEPTVQPSAQPTASPTGPSSQPSAQPSRQPSARPSAEPSQPSGQPSGQPTSAPSAANALPASMLCDFNGQSYPCGEFIGAVSSIGVTVIVLLALLTIYRTRRSLGSKVDVKGDEKARQSVSLKALEGGAERGSGKEQSEKDARFAERRRALRQKRLDAVFRMDKKASRIASRRRAGGGRSRSGFFPGRQAEEECSDGEGSTSSSSSCASPRQQEQTRAPAAATAPPVPPSSKASLRRTAYRKSVMIQEITFERDQKPFSVKTTTSAAEKQALGGGEEGQQGGHTCTEFVEVSFDLEAQYPRRDEDIVFHRDSLHKYTT